MYQPKSSFHARQALRFVLLLCLFCSGNSLHAQLFEWVRQYGAQNRTTGHEIAIDSSNHVISAGVFRDVVDFDPGPAVFNLAASGVRDVYISKLNSAGDFIWARQLACVSPLSPGSIAIDDTGNVYITGAFSDTLDVDPGSTVLNFVPLGNIDAYVIKLNPMGEYVWARQIGDSLGNVSAADIAVDREGNVYTTGIFFSSVDFDPGPDTLRLSVASGTSFTSAVYIQKLDASGNFVWAKSLAGTSLQSTAANTIAVDERGNVYTGGGFEGIQDFDPGMSSFTLSSVGNQDVFLSKLDSTGSFVWAKQFRGNAIKSISEIKIGNNQNLYGTGWFRGTVDFDPGPDTLAISALTNSEVFVCRLDSIGDLVWAKAFIGTSSNLGNGISLDEQENAYITGAFMGTIDFDPGPDTVSVTAVGSQDIFVSKLDVNGQYVWSVQMGGFDNDVALDIALDRQANVYTTGFFRFTADFDPGAGVFNLTPLGIEDAFVHRLNTCEPSLGSLTVSVCDSYTSPSGNHLWTRSGVYLDTIPNAVGCDSILTINLSINNTFANISPISCDTYLSPGGKNWTSNGTYLDTIPNTAGCDSIITINLTILTSTNSTIAPAVCDTYISPGGKSWTSSGTYLDTIPNTAGCDSLITINLTVNTTTSTIAPIACISYTSPSGKNLWTTSGTYLDTIPNTAGCDSLITIHLTIDSVDVSVVNNSPSLMAKASDAAYQWLDCNDSFSMIIGATTQNYLPTVNGSYAVEISQGACIDTSVCEVVGNVAILKNDFGSDLLLYPNPTQDRVIIELGESYDAILLSLHNQLGQALWHQHYGRVHRIEFPLAEGAGVYLLSIRAGDKAAQLKVIKQ